MAQIKQRKPVRSLSGEPYRTNSTIKRYLAPDFHNKCGYCDDIHDYAGGASNYHVDHHAPKSKFPHLQFRYENLVYCCPYCNRAKSDKWLGNTPEENIIDGKGFVDPCSDEYLLHLERDENGCIVPRDSIGHYMYSELNLYLERHRIIYCLEQIDIRIEALKAKINEKNSRGERVEHLESIRNELCFKFHSYFKAFTHGGNIPCEQYQQ